MAPYAAVEVDLAGSLTGRVEVRLTGPGETCLAARLDHRRISLAVTTGGETTVHRSRRHGRVRDRPGQVAVTLTGTHLTAFTREQGGWVARCRVDLAERLDPRDSEWLAGLHSGWTWQGDDPPPVAGWRAGRFGQLGLRDLRLVTHADGQPYRTDGQVFLTATSAGPGFFDTGHTSVWRLDPDLRLEHCSDLFFTRADRPGAFGDHATHLLRHDDRWLVATSTWGDFEPSEKSARVDVTIAESPDDLLTGQHLLPTHPLPLPTDGLDSVGVWDPHLVLDGEQWLVGFVSAREFFDFHPALAVGPDLARLTLRAAATDRTGTEGTTLLRGPDGWQVLASDGRDNPRRLRRRYPVFDLDLRETGTIDAPYLSNIGWPTLVPPMADEPWSMVTFDGTPYGGRLAGYGTHGNTLVLRPRCP